MEAAGLLDAGRAAFQNNRYGRIGLSASSRASLNDFYNNAVSLFNSLYNTTEDQEVYNQTAILALRSKYSYLATDNIKTKLDSDKSTKAGITSSTTGTTVNKTA